MKKTLSQLIKDIADDLKTEKTENIIDSMECQCRQLILLHLREVLHIIHEHDPLQEITNHIQ